jgi:predicted GIY-YIG superfamily endonuclease
MSYGYFVDLERRERRLKIIGRLPWWSAALKYANDCFPEFPEHRVVHALGKWEWPEHSVSFSELKRFLRNVVPEDEQKRWVRDLDDDADMAAWDLELDATLFDWFDIAGVECWFLYRIYSLEDELLYIGITSRGWKRVSTHMKQKQWWPADGARVGVRAYATEFDVRRAERAAIRAEHPLHNKHHKVPAPPGSQFVVFSHKEDGRAA